MNEFEQRLRQQPFSGPPPELRERVLKAVERVQGKTSTEESPDPIGFFKRLLGLHPVLWSSFAGVWMVILVLNFDTQRMAAESQNTAHNHTPVSTATLERHQSFLREMLDSERLADAPNESSEIRWFKDAPPLMLTLQPYLTV